MEYNEITITTESIENYCRAHTTPPTLVQKELIAATQSRATSGAQMQVGPLEGQFLTLIASITHAQTAIEFGTFTGYSALALAEGVAKRVTTLDRDPVSTAIAREFWAKSELHSKIELILGDAKQSVLTLEKEIQAGSRPAFDLAFIDADKAGYAQYLEASLKLVRKGGVILVDNVLWSGRVLNPSDKSDFVIHEFNQKLFADPRLKKVMLPIRDGIFLAQIL